MITTSQPGKKVTDLEYNRKLRIEAQTALRSIVQQLEGIDPGEWSTAERNIYRIAYAELQK